MSTVETERKALFPLDTTETTPGMKFDLAGVLLRAADRLKRTRDQKQLEWPLVELRKHIEELRASKNDEEALEKLQEFLRLWV